MVAGKPEAAVPMSEADAERLMQLSPPRQVTSMICVLCCLLFAFSYGIRVGSIDAVLSFEVDCFVCLSRLDRSVHILMYRQMRHIIYTRRDMWMHRQIQ